MSGQVALGSAMRANLLSLQNTNSLLDVTQLRLSTGKKINSALDGAQAFFASQALTNRANDLSKLLDGMGQSIQTIKQADKSVSAITQLVEQADSIAQQARDEVATNAQEAKVTGNVNLKTVTDITSLNGIANGDKLVVKAFNPDGTIAFNTKTVTLSTDDSVDQVLAKINDVNQGLSENVIEATLNDSGQLQIKGLDGAQFEVKFETAADAEDTAANLSLATALGFGTLADTVGDGTEDGSDAQQNDVKITALSTPSITSAALYRNNSSEFARTSDVISAAASGGGASLRTKANSTAASDALFNQGATLGDKIVFGYNGKSGTAIAVSATTSLQSVIDAINNDAVTKGKIQATYDETSGKLNIRAVDASVTTVQFGIEEQTDGETSTARFGFGLGAFGADATDISATGAGNPIKAVESLRLGASAGNLAKLEQDYNKVRAQIDGIADDAGYRGTNLLKGDSLLTVFNEDRTTSLTSTGVVFTSDGLGLTEANFSSSAKADSSLNEVRSALDAVRNFGSSLANDLAVVQTRQDFTKDTIQTLTEGSDKLTLADQNEEGAKMLALQTRLQLGVTSLSLAAQSQRSVLSLF